MPYHTRGKPDVTNEVKKGKTTFQGDSGRNQTKSRLGTDTIPPGKLQQQCTDGIYGCSILLCIPGTWGICVSTYQVLPNQRQVVSYEYTSLGYEYICINMIYRTTGYSYEYTGGCTLVVSCTRC